MDTLEEGTR
jgi:hypothetical protein